MTVYQSACLEIDYDETHKLVETCWLAFASSQEYRAGLMTYIDVIKAYPVKRWLGDYRLARVVRLEDQQWIKNTWAPTFFPLAGDIEKMAKVNALDVGNQISSANIEKQINEIRLPFLFQAFDDYEQARAWVLQ
jgi:hypothetical protein